MQKTKLKEMTKDKDTFNDYADLKMNVSHIINNDLMPCVVFTFSRAKCESLAKAMQGVDVANSAEKALIKSFM